MVELIFDALDFARALKLCNYLSRGCEHSFINIIASKDQSKLQLQAGVVAATIYIRTLRGDDCSFRIDVFQPRFRVMESIDRCGLPAVVICTVKDDTVSILTKYHEDNAFAAVDISTRVEHALSVDNIEPPSTSSRFRVNPRILADAIKRLMAAADWYGTYEFRNVRIEPHKDSLDLVAINEGEQIVRINVPAKLVAGSLMASIAVNERLADNIHDCLPLFETLDILLTPDYLFLVNETTRIRVPCKVAVDSQPKTSTGELENVIIVERHKLQKAADLLEVLENTAHDATLEFTSGKLNIYVKAGTTTISINGINTESYGLGDDRFNVSCSAFVRSIKQLRHDFINIKRRHNTICLSDTATSNMFTLMLKE